jgi:sulfiredoxin
VAASLNYWRSIGRYAIAELVISTGPDANILLGNCRLRAWSGSQHMLKREKFGIETIYVPVKRRRTLDPKRVEEIAESMLVNGQTTPILVRPDGARFVLIEGLHRLEAAKALGEQTIIGFRVAARKH